MKLFDIRVNYLSNPVLDSLPLLSWKVAEGFQKSYRVEVRDEEEKLVLDSSEVNSTSNVFSFKNFLSRAFTRYQIKLTVTDSFNEKESCNSFFITGKKNQPWCGKWISAGFAKNRGNKDKLKAHYLEKRFSVGAGIKKAYLAISGLGYCKAFVNDSDTCDDYLRTPYSDFNKRVYYRVFDVKPLIKEGENTLTVVLGNGFFNIENDDPWHFNAAGWRDDPKLICELHLFDALNKEIVISSDESWFSSSGPIIYNEMRHGEYYDSRIVPLTEDSPDYGKAVRVRAPGGVLELMEMNPIREIKRFKPVKTWRVGGASLFDFGQSFSGVATLRLKSKAGSKIRICYCDILGEDGLLDNAKLACFSKGTPFHTDYYIKHSDNPECWTPSFVYHGFRYIEISSSEEVEYTLEDVEAIAICNAFGSTSYFKTDYPMLDKANELCRWSVLSEGISVMASDTEREQTSWTGDTGFSAEQMYENFECHDFFRKWQKDLWDSQRVSGTVPCIVPSPGWGYNALNGPDWSNPMYEVPRMGYRYYGDFALVEKNYPYLKRYCSYLKSMSVDDIVDYGLGDWCCPFEGEALFVTMSACKCPVPVSDTAFYYAALDFAYKSALLLEKKTEAEYFFIEKERVKEAFARHFILDGIVKGNCTTSTAIAMELGLIEDSKENAEILVRQIHENKDRLDFGIIGMKMVTLVLGRHGYVDLCLDMLFANGYPSIAHWIDLGATTLWECWNGDASHNHHMFSSVAAFFNRFVIGIGPADEAVRYNKVELRPYLFGKIKKAVASFNTPNGMIDYSLEDNGSVIKLEYNLPEMVEADILIREKKDVVIQSIELEGEKELKAGCLTSFPGGKHSITIKYSV